MKSLKNMGLDETPRLTTRMKWCNECSRQVGDEAGKARRTCKRA